MSAHKGPSPADVLAAMQRGGITEALKLVLVQKTTGARRERNLGGPTAHPPKPHNATAATPATPASSDASELSPGEVSRSSIDVWLVLALVALLCFYFAIS
jgi:hypothetical protein